MVENIGEAGKKYDKARRENQGKNEGKGKGEIEKESREFNFYLLEDPKKKGMALNLNESETRSLLLKSMTFLSGVIIGLAFPLVLGVIVLH